MSLKDDEILIKLLILSLLKVKIKRNQVEKQVI